MYLKKYTISQLEQFILSGEFRQYSVVPITPQRAFSQIKNPNAQPEDVVLTLAFSDEDELVGYIGALPGSINGTRCAWNSCWWVKSGTPAEISMSLMFSFLNDWKRNVLFSEMTPHTLFLIEQMRFCMHKTIYGFRGYYRFCLGTVLPRKGNFFKYFRYILHTADYVMNLFINAIGYLAPKNDVHSSAQIEEIDSPPDELDNFISRYNLLQPDKRMSEDFRWITNNPWLVEKAKADRDIATRYYFSYAVSRFEMRWVKFSINGELAGLVCYTIRDQQLKLPYVYAEDSCIEEIGNFLFALLKANKKICTVTTFHNKLGLHLRKRKKYLFQTNLPKYSAISNYLLKSNSLTDVEFQMGDGDVIFT